MIDADSKAHWQNIYSAKSSKDVSWYSPHLEKSIELILKLGLSKEAEIIDVGGGASTLPDDLLSKGFKNIMVLDISKEALKVSQERLKDKAMSIQWLEADITAIELKPNHYDLWHDRAVFHFLTHQDDRRKYINTLQSTVKPGGHVLIATFGPNGPLKCSGLEIVRYSPENLKKELGNGFELKKSFIESHTTPFNTQQEFLYCLFRKL